MVIYIFLITWIINSTIGTGMLVQNNLVHLKHNFALRNDSFAQIYGIAVYGCYEECFYRKKCRSFNFRRKFKVCILNSGDSEGDLPLAEAHGYAYGEKLLWDMSQLPVICSQCTEQERCRMEMTDNACVKEECSPPQLGPHERLLGNLFEVGNRYKVVNDNSGHEKSYTCSELSDIGTVLGGDSIYSCMMEHSVCLVRKCSCLPRAMEVGGYCIVGNQRITFILSQGDYELRVDLEDFEGNTRYAKYNAFSIGDFNDNYALTISGYSGNAGDSLAIHSRAEFSTFDHDSSSHHCANRYRGAWWYKTCHQSNLNGLYLKGWHNDSYANGVDWYDWKGYYYSLKRTEMKIRRVKV